MFVTMLEAEVADEDAGELVASFGAETDYLPTAIRETFLLRESGGDLWRLATVWESKEALEGYIASVETPGGVLMFRSAGADPTLTIFEVADHADHA